MLLARLAAWSFAICLFAAPGHGGTASLAQRSADPAPPPQITAAAVPVAARNIPADGQNIPADARVPDLPAKSAAPPPISAAAAVPAEAITAVASPPAVQVAALDPAQPSVRSTDAPFGLAAVRIGGGDVLTKWQTVEAEIQADNAILAQCRDGTATCPPAAQNFLAIIAQGRSLTGRARIGVINRAVNLAIAPMSDMAQWGVADHWSAPLETLSTGHGDCEDYAIAKYVALTAAGVAAVDVKLIIVRNTAAHQDHAIVAVRLDGNWLTLDNRWLTLVADRDLAAAVPLFVLDDDGVRQFAPLVPIATAPASTPASLGF